jgi:pyrroloquinoline quinone biosynthesis protein D
VTWSPQRVPAVSEGSVSSRVGEDFVLLDPSGTLLRGLNATAARVWELVDGRRSVLEIARAVAAAWAIDEERALEDVSRFMQILADRELIHS